MQQVSAISTGEYTAIIDNNATTIGCPFGSGDTVEIDRTGVAEAANDDILLNRVLDEDYLFVATYTNSSTGLVVKVNYTYKATILPNSQLVDK